MLQTTIVWDGDAFASPSYVAGEIQRLNEHHWGAGRASALDLNNAAVNSGKLF
jgi:hypothetical protein